VRCEQFLVAHYDNGMPKEYVSRLTFIENGTARASGEVRVNHPLAYQGLRFYQESYYGHPAAVFTVTDGVRAWSIRAREGDELTMDDGRLSFRVAKIGQDVMRMGPALKLVIAGASGPRNLWLFQEVDRIKEAIPDLYERAPSFNPALAEPYTFALMEIVPDYATGIGVKRDPGAIIVAAGGVLMLICLLIVFLVPSLKVWIRLEEQGGSSHLTFSASRGGRPGDFPAEWLARIREEGDA
jgi:cytochrome c biogenesis protein